MGKNTRGKNIIGVQKKRGTCPVCGRGGVKLLYTKKDGEQTLNVCKHCKSSS